MKTKLGLAVAPYPGQVTFVEKTPEEVLRVLTEDLWMTVQCHDQPAQGEESWTLVSNNRYPGAASQEYEQQKTEYQAREKKNMDFYNYREKLKNDADFGHLVIWSSSFLVIQSSDHLDILSSFLALMLTN